MVSTAEAGLTTTSIADGEGFYIYVVTDSGGHWLGLFPSANAVSVEKKRADMVKVVREVWVVDPPRDVSAQEVSCPPHPFQRITPVHH